MIKKKTRLVRNTANWLFFFILFFIFTVCPGYTGKTAFHEECLSYRVYIRGIPWGNSLCGWREKRFTRGSRYIILKPHCGVMLLFPCFSGTGNKEYCIWIR